jgi:cell division protease FtsH
MSENLGPLTFGKKDEEVFLGRDFGSKRDFSEQIALEIDKEVKRLVVEAYERTTRMLTEHIHSLRAIAEALLEKEVLDGIEVDQIVQQSSSLEHIAAV